MVGISAVRAPATPRLPPPPDFRYVGLQPRARGRAAVWTALASAAAASSACLLTAPTARVALAMAALGTLATAGIARAGASRRVGVGPPLALVPWGVLVDPERGGRVLRWSAVKRVDVRMVHGRDEATPTTRWSEVTVDTGRERFVGCAEGAVAIDRLTVHLDAYAEEASHAVALDLEGEAPGDGPVEPDAEPLITSARAWLESAPASQRLDLPAAGYRAGAARAAGDRAVVALRGVLADRTPRPIDPRPFAAIVAAELGARELVADLVALVQAPHPLLAAVARVAAIRLGAPGAKVGTLEEVAPFLSLPDLEALEGWATAR